MLHSIYLTEELYIHMMEPSQKRQRTDSVKSIESINNGKDEVNEAPETLSLPISPPAKKRRGPGQQQRLLVRSPWQLTWIRDLPAAQNKDAVTLKDLLGDPLISECWQFNYLHDIGFIMDAFDHDIRHLVKLHVVHGFWKREDQNRLLLTEEASKYNNVQLHVAPMPEMFGTHHSKMMIIFRRDDSAQIIIHTANMISKDWTNMTNAVWKSPLLTKVEQKPAQGKSSQEETLADSYPVGSGERFKADLLSYLRSYDRHRLTCGPLANRLSHHDFSPIRAALIASVPGTHNIHDVSQTAWGWPALKRNLRSIPCQRGRSEMVIQISSIATLGAKDEWLQKTLFGSMLGLAGIGSTRPQFKVVFPTADEVRASLDGYESGGSIHMRIQSQQQAKQLEYMRPMFHHWANDCPQGKEIPHGATRKDGGRANASPHIKTYIRYNGGSIDWALLTSANLSKQAWGEALRLPTSEVRIASWEIGVLLWPDLIASGSLMKPTFQEDKPRAEDHDDENRPIVGIRVPYNMPLQEYGRSEVPWVATMKHAEPDRYGRVWGG